MTLSVFVLILATKSYKAGTFQLLPEKIFADMHDAKYLSKNDASNGFGKIPIDKDSSKLLTFNTPLVRYKFYRSPPPPPYGIHSANKIFQIEIGHVIKNIEGTRNIQDDIIV